MTTKEALEIAINLMRDQSECYYSKPIKLLEQLKRRDLVTKWTQESIIEALDDWERKHGRHPTTSSLIEPGMPGANIIQKHFGMCSSAFLRKRYSDNNNSPTRHNCYGFVNQEDWIQCFREQFLKHCGEDGFNSKTYNSLKDKHTPLWMTIANHCQTSQWSKLMELANVHYPNRCNNASNTKIVAVKSPWLEQFETAINKRETLDRELIQLLNKK